MAFNAGLAWVETATASKAAAGIMPRAVIETDLGTQAAIDAMTGVEIEHYVAAVLRGHGYGVEFTRATGDFGVDLIATRDGVRTAVQCKRQARAVNGSAIQQVVGGAPVHGCTKTMVVCNHRYTRAAELLAAVHDCLLVDRGRLARLARRPPV